MTTVWVPPGTFLLSDHVVLQDGVTLRGAGPFYTILQGEPQAEGSKKSVGVYGKKVSSRRGRRTAERTHRHRCYRRLDASLQ